MLRTLWFNARWRAWLWQLLLLTVVLGGLAWLLHNGMTNLAQRGITSGFDFLTHTARFPISESLLSYESTDTFGRALLVGLVNTLVVAGVVAVLSTVGGLLLALVRRAWHPIIAGAGTVYVEVMRNTPLVVQLLFWYGAVTIGLPPVAEAWSPLPGVFFSLRGIALPGFGGSGLLGLDLPQLEGLGFAGGMLLTPELSALLLGLVMYSTAFSGEIIRGGIAAVPRGQWEAAHALGLRPWPLLRLVVFPQALRTIIPPMTSQYLVIVKNTTLGLAVGYPDLAFVISTTINQTGQAVEGVLLLMGVFLSLSLVVSLFMNWYNRRVLRWQG